MSETGNEGGDVQPPPAVRRIVVSANTVIVVPLIARSRGWLTNAKLATLQTCWYGNNINTTCNITTFFGMKTVFFGVFFCFL